MKNFIQEGDSLTLIAPSGGVIPGMLYVVGAIAAVSQDTAAAAAEFVGCTTGVFSLPKAAASGVTFAAGAKVSWDASSKLCVAPASGKYPIGAAIVAAVDADAVVSVRLDEISTATA